MKTAVVIATHQRIEITSQNIRCLLQQSEIPEIILVVSERSEFRYFVENFKEVRVVCVQNDPLGAKWQKGVDVAKELNADTVIICGSDDILSKNFIENSNRLIPTYNFIGIQKWYIFDPAKELLYFFRYQPTAYPNFPLGGGRCYSKKFLDKINWRLFDIQRSNLLDDKGFFSGIMEKHLILGEPEKFGLEILAIKGNWEMMNPLEITLNHKNARIIDIYKGDKMNKILKDKFNINQ